MCDCSAEHEIIETKLDHLDSLLEYHTAEVHGTLVERQEIEETNEQFISAMLGPKRQDGLHAGTRIKEEGMEYKVNELWKMAHNGGWNARLARKDRIALYGPTVGAIAIILAAVIGVF